jgi:hypothetical protein
MTVYLGNFGQVELLRQFGEGELIATIGAADVNATKKRFSFEFDHGQLITGDEVEIVRTDGSDLDFISGYSNKGVKKFVYVDELDGIRLYDTFAAAVAGLTTNATTLATPSADFPVKIIVKNSAYRVLGRVQQYELNTERETVDTTTLSDEFRSRVSTLMSGSGRMSCEWEYTGDDSRELPHYLLELAIRTKIGSNFKAKFYLKTSGYNPGGYSNASNDQVWYDVSGVITACAVQFAPGQKVQITADFITTGILQLRMDLTSNVNLLQENSDDILLEQDSTAKLSLQQVD